MYDYIQFLKLIFLYFMLCKNHNTQKHALLTSYLHSCSLELYTDLIKLCNQQKQYHLLRDLQFEDEDENPFDSLDDNFEDSVNDPALFTMSSVHCIVCSQLQIICSIFKYNVSRKCTFWLDNSLSYAKLDLHEQIKRLRFTKNQTHLGIQYLHFCILSTYMHNHSYKYS